jgi:hypothetical protein
MDVKGFPLVVTYQKLFIYPYGHEVSDSRLLCISCAVLAVLKLACTR